MVTKTSCSFSSRSVKDAAQILRWDRGDEQLTPSSGTGVHCQRLHQNNAAFLYDKRQFRGLKGKLGRVCQTPGWSWVWSSVDSWENLFSKSSSSLNTQEKTNLLWYPFLTCSLSLSSGHTGGWNLYQKHPLRWLCSEHGTYVLASAQPPRNPGWKKSDGSNSSQDDHLPLRSSSEQQQPHRIIIGLGRLQSKGDSYTDQHERLVSGQSSCEGFAMKGTLLRKPASKVGLITL